MAADRDAWNPPMIGRKVVQAAPVARGRAIIATALALPAFAVTVTLAEHWLDALVVSVFTAILWSGGMTVMLRIIHNIEPSPVPVEQNELPPIAATWKATAFAAALLTVLDAGALAFSLAVQPQTYIVVGIILGAPGVIWSSFLRIERTQRQYQGTLWCSTGFAWTSKGRSPYIVRS
jgi:hypothetical protein